MRRGAALPVGNGVVSMRETARYSCARIYSVAAEIDNVSTVLLNWHRGHHSASNSSRALHRSHSWLRCPFQRLGFGGLVLVCPACIRVQTVPNYNWTVLAQSMLVQQTKPGKQIGGLSLSHWLLCLLTESTPPPRHTRTHPHSHWHSLIHR